MFQKLYHRNFQNIFYLSLLPRSHYENVRTANLPCHWLRSPWRRNDIFRYSPVVKKEVALFVNIDEKKIDIKRFEKIAMLDRLLFVANINY